MIPAAAVRPFSAALPLVSRRRLLNQRPSKKSRKSDLRKWQVVLYEPTDFIHHSPTTGNWLRKIGLLWKKSVSPWALPWE